MKKIRESLGRGYMFGYFTLGATLVLTVVALLKHPNQYQFVLAFWTDFIMYFVVPLVGAKEIGKVGTAFANRKKVVVTDTAKPQKKG